LQDLIILFLLAKQQLITCYKDFKGGAANEYYHLTQSHYNTINNWDHGTLNGLLDDDHSQYLLANGTRPLSNNWDIGDYGVSGINYLDFNVNAASSSLTGRLRWNNVDYCLEYDSYINGTTVANQIGQEIWIRVRNNSGSDIEDGRPVYISGALGNRPTIALANANSITTAKTFSGITTQAIPENYDGFVTVIGSVRALDTTGAPYGETWNEGDLIYVSATIAGTLTNIRPTAPNFACFVGIVTVVNASNGEIGVKALTQPVLSQLSDIYTSGVADGDLISWSAANNRWENTTLDSIPTSFAQGSVIFQGSTGLEEDNTNLFWDDVNKKIKIGKSLSVYHDGTDGYIATNEVAASDLIVSCGTNKTIELTESVWDDQQVNLGTVGFGSSAPNWRSYVGSEVLGFANNQNNSITFAIQYSHKIKIGSSTEFHLHVVEPNGLSGNVRWQLTVSYASIGDTFGSPSTITQTQNIGAQDTHTTFEFTNTFVSNTGISGIALCSLTRLGSDTEDTYPGEIYLIALDSHFQIDTIGSRQETVK